MKPEKFVICPGLPAGFSEGGNPEMDGIFFAEVLRDFGGTGAEVRRFRPDLSTPPGARPLPSGAAIRAATPDEPPDDPLDKPMEKPKESPNR
jgi:hypothetical protein